MVDPGNMTFQRFGRTYHLRIQCAKDLARVLRLDEAHWIATSMPIHSVRGNIVFMRLVDTNQDGRIHALELKRAIEWLLAHLRQTSGVDEASQALQLSSINTDRDDGRRILESCQKMLTALGPTDTDRITLDQIRQIRARVESETVSEAGVVLPDAAADEDLRGFLEHIVATIGGAPHPGGNTGVDQAHLDAFLKQTRSYLDWLAISDAASEDRNHGSPHGSRCGDGGAMWPLGPDTESAYAILAELSPKLDQYFTQCQVLAIDERFAGHLPLPDKEITAADIADPESVQGLLARASIAPPVPECVLDLAGRIHPWYAGRLARLRTEVLEPLSGGPIQRLTMDQWQSVKERFSAYGRWLIAKPADAVAVLDREQLARYLDPAYARAVQALIQQSRETALKLDNIRLAEKLVLYQANLLTFANNFVSFPHLYDPSSRAVFESGTLVMDGRRFDLAVRVDDLNQHANVAGSSGMFVIYATVDDKTAPYVVAVPVTSGGKGNLGVGKRGVFCDIQGRWWDAKIIRMIENPVSINEAITAPFRRVGGLISQKIDRMTGAAEADLDAATQQVFEGAPAPTPTTSPTPSPTQSARALQTGGVLAGGGVAIAAMGSSLAYISKIVVQFPIAMAVGLAGAILAVLVPSTVLAVIRLRRHDLSAILEGSGWAINARMRLTHGQRCHFTKRPAYPHGARGVRSLGSWWIVVVFVFVLAAAIGCGIGLRLLITRPN